MSWISRLQNAVRPRRLEEELAEELRDHLERRTAEHIAKGVAPEEAKRLAAQRFGNAMRLQEDSRQIRMWAALENLIQDVRYGWRTMRKSPGFALTAVFSLALAIGANTAIYSIVDAAMLRALPVTDPGRLFTLYSPDIVQPGSETGAVREAFSYSLLQRFRQAAGDSAHLALFSYPGLSEARIGGRESPLEKVMRQYVSGDTFELLGVSPALGRLFSREEDRTIGGHPLIVLSYDYWQRRFGADPKILGRIIQVDSKSFYVLGVVREGFFGIEPGRFVDVWLPATMYDNPEAFRHSGWSWFRIIGRLAPGVTREQIKARLQPVFHDRQQEIVASMPTIPEAIKKQFLNLSIQASFGASGVSQFRRTFARPLWIVLGVAAGILLIACANVASLLLARSTARSAEMAMRVSLGAGRARLVCQLLTESLMLSIMAGALGWLLARIAAPALVGLLSKETDPVQFALAMDTRVLFFCAAVSTLAAVFFGLLPAWQASGTKPMLALRAVAGQGGKLRLGRFFVGVQVACAFCLVMAGAAFLFSLRNLVRVDTGFDQRDVSVLSLVPDSPKKAGEAQRMGITQLRKQLLKLPQVQAAALADYAIFMGSFWSMQIIVPGKAPSDREELFYRVSPGYFATMRTPLLSGRDFEDFDSDAASLVPAVVNLAFARRYFGADNPLGRQFQYPDEKELVSLIVIGVAANANYGDLRKGVDPIVYVPSRANSAFTLYLRSPLSAGSVMKLVEREARTAAPDVRVRQITTLEALVGNSILREKLLAGIGGVFALLGLLLAAIGLFGLLNYSVVRRTKEIGIRSALGARKRGLVLLILKDLFALVSGGLIAGLAGSLAMMTVFRSLLFGVRTADPLVMGTAATVFLAAALIAGGLPARRAAAVDPMIALRHE